MGKAKRITTAPRKNVRAVDADRWMPMFVARWLDDPRIRDPQTGDRGLTLAQEGAYLRLCLTQYRQPSGVLPGRRAFLVDAVGCADADFEVLVGPVLATFFELTPEGWSHDTVRALWLSSNSIRIQRAEAANSRWKKARNASAHALASSDIEIEREIEREKDSPGAAAPRTPRPLAEQTDQQAAVTVWVEKMGPVAVKGKGGRWVGGMSPSRIVASLAPLFRDHGREKVIANWRRYLSTREPQFASPEEFCQKYVAWASSRGVKPVPL